jgi:GT2 family glycosyltransferase
MKVIVDCLKSIFRSPENGDFEVIVSDNGSTDGSVPFIRQNFPTVKIVENGANLGFAAGNNAGIKVAQGEYILILNPDTIIHEGALSKWLAFADRHPKAGAFGCRVLNPDGSFQNPARPLPAVSGFLVAALCLRWLGRLLPFIESDVYPGWDGREEREIGFQSGCCILFRAELLKRLGGFDERFFYHAEESDLCYRIWKSGASILYYPGAEITHLGGQSVGRFPIRFALETFRSGYRYFYKHDGIKGAKRMRRVYLIHFGIRRAGYSLRNLFKPSEALQNRLKMYSIAIKWNYRLDPARFVQTGEEPDLGYEPMTRAPKLAGKTV